LKWVLTATVVVVLAFIAAGCGSSGQHHAAAAAATTSRSSAPCKLTGAQRRGVARAVADHQAKAAVRLCGDCSTGLETEEPVLGNRGLNHARCG